MVLNVPRQRFVNPFGLISHKVENLPCSEAAVLQCCHGKRLPPRVEEEFRVSHLHSTPATPWKRTIRDLWSGHLSTAKSSSGTICSIQTSYRETICGDYFCMKFSINLKKKCVLEARFSSFSVKSNSEITGLPARTESLKMYKHLQSPLCLLSLNMHYASSGC